MPEKVAPTPLPRPTQGPAVTARPAAATKQQVAPKGVICDGLADLRACGRLGTAKGCAGRHTIHSIVDDAADAAELRRMIEAWPSSGYVIGDTEAKAKQAAKDKVRPQAKAFCKAIGCPQGTCVQRSFTLRWDLEEEKYGEVWLFYTPTSVTCACEA